MDLNYLARLREQGGDVVATLDKLYKQERESEGCAGLEIGAVYDGAISYDYDFEELLEVLEIKHHEIDYNGKDLKLEKDNYIYLNDGSAQVAVPFIEEKNRHDDELGNEMFIFFNDMIELDASTHLPCDECRKLFLRDSLVNLDPVNERDDEFKEKYKGYDGMVCEDCYNKMAN